MGVVKRALAQMGVEGAAKGYVVALRRCSVEEIRNILEEIRDESGN